MKGKIWKALQILAVVTGVSVLGAAMYTTVQYLRTSPRFEVKKVRVLGFNRTAENHILSQADLPDRVNIFSVDLAGIRQRVETLQWVREAIVQRVFPDTVTIKVIERQPVGLARIRGRIYQFDADAVVLDFDPATGVNFPILDGLELKDQERNLRKVALYRKVVEELQGQHALSEIHINGEDEVSVVSLSDPLLVNLGVEDFRSKWVQFLQMRSRIQSEYPEVSQVDFRFRNQVILKMNEEAPAEKNVVWDVEKKSL